MFWTEEGRIQRALYRLHLYGRIFYSNVDDLQEVHAFEQAEFFFWEFPAYQRGELICLHDDFHLRLSDTYDRIEDGYVESVLAEISESDELDDEKSAENNNSEDKEDSDSGSDYIGPAIRWPPDNWVSVEPDINLFFRKSHKCRHRIRFRSVGLPSLRRFLEADNSEQTDMVKKVECNDKDSLSEALLVLGYNTSVQLAETMTSGYDHLRQPNEAYTWKHNSVLRDWYSSHGDGGLRESLRSTPLPGSTPRHIPITDSDFF